MATPRQKPTFQPRVLRSYSKWVEAPHVSQAVNRLQSWWRHWSRLKPQNNTDFITLEPFEKPIFVHVSDTEHVTAFSAHSLAQYFEAAGDFTHPQTRTPLNRVEIRRLDKLTHLQYKLLENYHAILERHQEERKQDELQEFLLNDFKTNYTRCVESCHPNIEDMEWTLRLRENTDALMGSVISLRQFNQALANAVLHQCIGELNSIFLRRPERISETTLERLFVFQQVLRNMALFM